MKQMIAVSLFAALAATGASAATAPHKHRSYQFLDGGGAPLCEAFVLDQYKTSIAIGTLVGGCSLKDPAGGLYGGVRKVSGGPAWTILVRETMFDADMQFIIVMNEKELTWTAFTQKDGTTPYSRITSGTLQDISGLPARNGRSLSSILREAKQHVSAKPAQPVDVHYTFAQMDGTPYCDGVTLTQSAMVAVGTYVGGSGCPQSHYAGGNYGYVKAVGEKVWTITTTSDGAPGSDVVLVLDENNMSWTAFAQGGGIGSFQEINNGALLEGDPPGATRKSALSAVSK